MKTTNQLIKLLFVPAIVGAGSMSCENFKVVTGVEKVVPVTVTVNAHVLCDANQPLPTALTVKFINGAELWTKEVEMDGSFFIRTDEIIPGNYTIAVTGELENESGKWIYNGITVNQNLLGEPKHYDIDVKVALASPLVLKEIYYACSPPGYTEDQFYEIYNNSEEIVYLDSLCFTRIHPNTATQVATLPAWAGDDWEDFVYAPDCWQIPGNGTDYPLAPGESAIMSERATNHQAAIYNPLSPCNQISCEFEFWILSASYPTDNPAINMNLVYGSASGRWLTTVFGAAFVLFRQTGPIDQNFTATTVTDATRYLKIRRKDVIDAVECVNNWAEAGNKRIPPELDMGATTVEATYNVKSIARKILSTRPDGTIIFQDTNNSTNDFEVMDPPILRRYGAKIPSWNTWHSLDPLFP